ncbi:MAG: murein biosynthesis integral membrane protein MurJ [Gammaproteobacteria bacterium]|nr:murein biosynthesis integral membrane protein MurJ [Gammaproteobacteria bacterium]MDH5651166.1 murein biosynthesis integral membrane protein MurJ [Gammaproteobacteria bacterium]
MGLLKSTAIVSTMTMVSRVLGLARDMVFTQIFGAGAGTDAFLVAFKIPNFLRRLFAEGAFSPAFVPVVTEYKQQRNHTEVHELVGRTAGTLGLILLAVTTVAIIAAPVVVGIFATGFLLNYPDKFDLTVQMLRITFPYILFISLTALAGSVLNVYGKFAVPALTPVFLNILLILAAVFLAPLMAEPVTALAWGVFIAGIVQLAFQIPFMAKLGLLGRPRWGWDHEGVRRIVKLMIPGIFGSAVMQINLLLDTVIASFLITGSVTWLYLSDRMMELPLGVLGIALATVILPALSRKHADANPRDFSHTIDWALRWVLLVGMPSAVGLAVLSGPIISTLFQHGQFSANDVRMAQLSLMAYSFGILGFIAVKVLAPGYFARQDTKSPVRIGVIAMVVNMVCNIAFVVPMVMLDFTGPHTGLAMATTVSSFVNAGLLLRGLWKSGVYQPDAGWGRLFVQVILANSVMLAVLWGMSGHLDTWLSAGVLMRSGWLAGIVLVGAVVYFAMLWLLGLRLHQLRRPAESAR